jgi:hypothetical protein
MMRAERRLERPPAVEVLLHDAGGEALELLVAARVRQAGVAQVEVEVERRVVDPDGGALEGRPLEHLAVARDSMQDRGVCLANRFEVDAAALGTQGAGVEDLRRGDVGVGHRPLEHEEGVVERRQAVVGVGGHRGGILLAHILRASRAGARQCR